MKTFLTSSYFHEFLDRNASYRDRKRNFVSARTGFVGVWITFIATTIFHFIYNFEFWTFNTCKLDSSTKAYFMAVMSDILDCIIHPCVLLAGTPSVKNALKKWNWRETMFKFILILKKFRLSE